MARTFRRLNASSLGRLPPGRHHDGAGLYLLVGKGTARSWVYRYMIGGEAHDHGLGPLALISLAAARQKAHECRSELYAKRDPATRQGRRHEARIAAKTFAEAAEAFMAPPRKFDKQRSQQLTTYAFPVLGPTPVATIDTAMVQQVLDPLWCEGGKPETASRLRRHIAAVIDYAMVKGWRPEGFNPAAWEGRLDKIYASRRKIQQVESYAALPFLEIAGFMTELRAIGSNAARGLELLVLTGLRTDEVRLAQWTEFEGDVWTIPAERMKARKQHRVPLSEDALAILNQMRALPHGKYIFPGLPGRTERPIGPQAFRNVMKQLGRPDFKPHGFRSTFRDWAGETNAAPREVIEMCIAHRLGDDAEKAYARGDLLARRRELMERWATECRTEGRPRPRLVASR